MLRAPKGEGILLSLAVGFPCDLLSFIMACILRIVLPVQIPPYFFDTSCMLSCALPSLDAVRGDHSAFTVFPPAGLSRDSSKYVVCDKSLQYALALTTFLFLSCCPRPAPVHGRYLTCFSFLMCCPSR